MHLHFSELHSHFTFVLRLDDTLDGCSRQGCSKGAEEDDAPAQLAHGRAM